MSQKPTKLRVPDIVAMKSEGRKVACMTATDTLTARWADEAGVDLILVGDSLGTTSLGMPNTLRVTLDTMIHHAAAVARGAKRALRIGDMPFMTYKITPEQALENCARMITEGMTEGIKLEGGLELAATVEKVVQAGIPVMGHIGLLPQSFHAQGGYRLQGATDSAAERLLVDAQAIEQAGAFCLVLEKIPADLAARITAAVSIPTIGIGAGPQCDGQVLVLADALGMTERVPMKLAKVYANLYEVAKGGLQQYVEEVRGGQFPTDEHTYKA